jgi:pilus assembly protein Flp/PilA
MNWHSRDREDGASAVEYGLLVAGIAALIVLIVFAFGGIIGNLFDNSCGNIAGEITGATCGP